MLGVKRVYLGVGELELMFFEEKIVLGGWWWVVGSLFIYFLVYLFVGVLRNNVEFDFRFYLEFFS